MPPVWVAGMDAAGELNLKLVNNDVRASKGEQTVPGVVITERKSLSGRV